jgi:hypothetical protein
MLLCCNFFFVHKECPCKGWSLYIWNSLHITQGHDPQGTEDGLKINHMLVNKERTTTQQHIIFNYI